jgi:MFS family permease
VFDDYRGMPLEAKYLILQSIMPSFAYGMFYMDISYFLTTIQGLPYGTMGIIITLMGVSTFISSILLGIAADKYGRRRLYIIGNIIASSIIALFALTTNPAILITAALLEGISEGAFSASGSALIAEKAGDKRRTSIFSLFGFVQNIAFGMGSIILLTVAFFETAGFTTAQSHTILYVTLAALSLTSTLFMLKITESKTLKKLVQPTKGELVKKSWVRRLPKRLQKLGDMMPKKLARVKQKYILAGDRFLTRLRRAGYMMPQKSGKVIIKYVLASAIVAFGAGLIVPLMTAWLKAQYGVSDAISGPILGVANIVIGVATLAAPPLAKKIGLVKAIVVTQGFSTLFMFLTPLQPGYLSASFVYTVRAFLMNMASPLQQSMIMGLVAEDERGAASGVSAAFWRLPNALSTSIGASLIGIGLLAAPFFLAGTFYIVSIALFWSFFRNTKLPEEQKTT